MDVGRGARLGHVHLSDRLLPGIGGGGLVNSKLMHGLSHPEMGHIRIPRYTTRPV
ncbi:MAG: hypothetical protein U0X92_13290 [Anaerolineales bacterium]